MVDLKAVYLVVSGAGSARIVPDLLDALVQFRLPVYTLLTESARSIISSYHLADRQDHRLIEGYFDPLMLNGRVPGLTLVAPATFNTLNKISHGIADTLPHSLVAEAIGAGWPVIVAPAMNPALANHPQYAQSMKTLRQWGVHVLDPQPKEERLIMASVEQIIAVVNATLQATEGRKDE